MADTHARLTWDEDTERFYETGLRNGVLYIKGENGYEAGVSWNGLTDIKEQNDGAEAKSLYANDHEYLKLRSKEKAKGTIEAYTYPDEFAQCDGSVQIVPGMFVGQQTRRSFGLCWRTSIGNDVEFSDHAYKLHILYGASISPSEKDHKTEGEDPEAVALSWSYEAIPVAMPEKLTDAAKIEIDSRYVTEAKMKQLEDLLYGSNTADAKLPTPQEIYTLLKEA